MGELGQNKRYTHSQGHNLNYKEIGQTKFTVYMAADGLCAVLVTDLRYNSDTATMACIELLNDNLRPYL